MAKDTSAKTDDSAKIARPVIPTTKTEAQLDALHVPMWMEHKDGSVIRCDVRNEDEWAERGFAPVTVERAKQLNEARAIAVAEAEVAAEKAREANKLTRLERELAELRAAQGARR